MATKTLTRASNCYWCKQPMAVGEPFKWEVKRGTRFSTRANIPDRYYPAHPFYCLRAQDEARAAEERARSRASTLDMLTKIAGEEMALEVVNQMYPEPT